MLIRIAAVVCLAAMLSACGGISSPSENHVETPSGTVSSGGVGPVHTFTVDKVGEFFVTITALSPDQNIFLGIVAGQPANNTCPANLQSNFQAHLNAQALGGQIEKGTWCVQLGDVGFVSPSTPTTYTLRLSYP
jgi:hypothetical protein